MFIVYGRKNVEDEWKYVMTCTTKMMAESQAECQIKLGRYAETHVHVIKPPDQILDYLPKEVNSI